MHINFKTKFLDPKNPKKTPKKTLKKHLKTLPRWAYSLGSLSLQKLTTITEQQFKNISEKKRLLCTHFATLCQLFSNSWMTPWWWDSVSAPTEDLEVLQVVEKPTKLVYQPTRQPSSGPIGPSGTQLCPAIRGPGLSNGHFINT